MAIMIKLYGAREYKNIDYAESTLIMYMQQLRQFEILPIGYKLGKNINIKYAGQDINKYLTFARITSRVIYVLDGCKRVGTLLIDMYLIPDTIQSLPHYHKYHK